MIANPAQLIRNAATVAWAALVTLTLISWWLSTDHGVKDLTVSSVLVLVVAFAKVRFVGLYFMELRDAPLALRVTYEGWCLVVCAVLCVLYVVGVG